MSTSREEKRKPPTTSTKTMIMPEKDPSYWAPILAIVLGVFGAILRLLQEWSGGRITPRVLWRWSLDLAASAFITMIVWMLAVYWLDLHPIAAAAVGGMAGHIGTRETILAIEEYIKRRLKK